MFICKCILSVFIRNSGQNLAHFIRKYGIFRHCVHLYVMHGWKAVLCHCLSTNSKFMFLLISLYYVLFLFHITYYILSYTI